jgi:deoxynogalonate / 12-deoxyaklanonic acid monooxygenase
MITFVNTFQVHGSPDEFERVFAETSQFLATQPGFLRYTLSRHVDEDKGDRYVNVALWQNVESLRRAVAHPDFRPHADRIRARSTSVANLYTPRQTFSVE